MTGKNVKGLLAIAAVLAVGGLAVFGGALGLFALWTLLTFVVVFVFSAVAHVFFGLAWLSFWKMVLLAVALRLSLTLIRAVLN